MGECGCSQFSADFRMPGPDGSVYLIMVYPSCNNCGTPVGVDVLKVNPRSTAAKWAGAATATRLEFDQDFHDAPMASFPVLDIDRLRELMGECWLDQRDVESVVVETVNGFRKGGK